MCLFVYLPGSGSLFVMRYCLSYSTTFEAAPGTVLLCVLFYSVVAAIAHVLWFALQCLMDFLFRAAR